jgi:hypothetical protein
MRTGRLVLALLLGTLAASGETRTGDRHGRLTDAMRSLYAEMFGDYVPTQTASALQRQAREAVAAADMDGGGLSQRDVDLARNMADAGERADRIRHYFGSDLNQDGVLTLDEYKAVLRHGDVQVFNYRYEAARRAGLPPPESVTEERTRDDGQIVGIFRQVDADHDGRLTLAEVFAFNFNQHAVAYWPAQRYVEAAKYLVLDSNGDGNVTMAEVDATSAAFLAEQSLAGVGPRPEATANDGDDRQGRVRLADAVQCPVPRPSSNARIVRLGTREGAQLSDIAIGGQGRPTYVVSVEIEPGVEPLYLVATSGEATIWRLTGAVRRVQAFVGSSRERDAHSMWPAVGVTGLPRARFHTVPYACFGTFDERNMRSPLAASEAAQLLLLRLDRTIDVAYGAYQPHGVRIPSAQPFQVPVEVPGLFTHLRSEAAARQWRDFLEHFRGGIAGLTAKQIVSRAVPELFEVDAYQAGLAQLLESGALAPVPRTSDFEILRSMRFPPGLYGGFSETFWIADGAPRPRGNPGHSRVMSLADPRLCLIGCR